MKHIRQHRIFIFVFVILLALTSTADAQQFIVRT